MSESKSKRNPYVQCVKCRNLWLGVGIFAGVFTLIIGYMFLDFYHHVNLIIAWDLIRYGGMFAVSLICGMFSFQSFRDYCTDKFMDEYRRDGEKLIAGFLTAFIVLLGTVFIVYFLPMTLLENEMRSMSDEEFKQAIIDMPCNQFNGNFGRNHYYGNHVNFELESWDTERGLYKRIMQLDQSKGQPEWLLKKSVECKWK